MDQRDMPGVAGTNRLTQVADDCFHFAGHLLPVAVPWMTSNGVIDSRIGNWLWAARKRVCKLVSAMSGCITKDRPRSNRRAEFGCSVCNLLIHIVYTRRCQMRISRWGNSYGVRLSKELMTLTGIKEGDELFPRLLNSGEVRLRPAHLRPANSTSTEDQPIARKTKVEDAW